MAFADEKFNLIFNTMLEEEKTREDIILPLGALKMEDNGEIKTSDGVITFGETAFAQLCQTLGMPVGYTVGLMEMNKTDLVAHHFNHFLNEIQDVERLFRIKNGQVHGVVSTSYVPFDNVDLLEVFADIRNEIPTVKLTNNFTDEKRMNLRLVFPEIADDFGDDIRGTKDELFVGFDLGNSENGFHSTSVTPMIWRLVCSNGMRSIVASGNTFRQRHIHSNPREFRRNLVAGIQASVGEGKPTLERLHKARNVKVNNATETIEKVGKSFKLSDKRIELVQDNFKRFDPEYSAYGIVNAFTRTAKDLKSADSRLLLEEKAGRYLASVL